VFIVAAQQTENRHPRLHGIRGLGQLGRKRLAMVKPAIEWLTDDDPLVRAEAVRVLGDCLYPCSVQLSERLADDDLRVRLLAANALARLGDTSTRPKLVAAARANTTGDRQLRSAIARALATLPGSPADDWRLDADAELRLTAVLTLREQADKRLALFLDDESESVRHAAVRAIHDPWVAAAAAALAALATPGLKPDPITWRIMNANFRLGTPENAARIAKLAESADSHEVRVEALKMLAMWKTPSVFDRVTWHHRPLGERKGDFAAAAGPALRRLMKKPATSKEDRQVAELTLRAASALGLRADAADLAAQITDAAYPAELRLAAIDMFGGQAGVGPALINALLTDKDPRLQGRGMRLLAAVDPEAAMDRVLAVLQGKDVSLKRQAYPVLATIDKPAAAALLRQALGGVDSAGDLQLEIIEACRAHPGLKQEIAAYDRRVAGDRAAKFRPALQGGDAVQGRYIFENHAAQCSRCHKSGKIAGGIVGPDLKGIGKRGDRAFLLESLINPGASVTKGYGVVTVRLKDGTVVSGVATAESADSLTLRIGEEKKTIAVKDIAERQAPVSAMPPMGNLLSLRELRDLVEFLTKQ
jgi:putative heme-binding domain-containing protein